MEEYANMQMSWERERERGRESGPFNGMWSRDGSSWECGRLIGPSGGPIRWRRANFQRRLEGHLPTAANYDRPLHIYYIIFFNFFNILSRFLHGNDKLLLVKNIFLPIRFNGGVNTPTGPNCAISPLN